MALPDRPFSAAAQRNREPIAAVLRAWLPPEGGRLLEIGSGTAQHARYCARVLPDWRWQPSEAPAEMPTLQAGLSDDDIPENVHDPITLDVAGSWPDAVFDAVFSANTAHIMHWKEVIAMFSGTAQVLTADGLFFLYGPFMRSGRHHAHGNAEFDRALEARDPGMGIRDLDDLDRLAGKSGLERVAELGMPANNHMLVFSKGNGS